MKGNFIVIEGLDGSGKTSQIQKLAALLKARGFPVHTTQEPTDGYIGRYIRQMLKKEIPPCGNTVQAVLFLADRLEHISNPENGILALTERGITVICDRFYYSSIAYQGLSIDMQWVEDINLNSPGMIKPDICIFLDVPPDVCMQRLNSDRGHMELFEKKDLLKKVRNNYLELFSRIGQNIHIINGNRDADTVNCDIMNLVMDYLH